MLERARELAPVDPHAALALLEDQAGFPAGERDAAWEAVRRACLRQGLVLEGLAATDPVLAFSPDGKTLATGRRKDGPSDEVVLWAALSGAPVGCLTDDREARPTALAFAPDSRTLAIAYQSFAADAAKNERTRVTFWDVTAQRPRTLPPRPEDVLRLVGVTAARPLAALPFGYAAVNLRSAVLRLGSDVAVVDMAFAPDGRTLFLLQGGDEGPVLRWEPTSGAEAQRVRPHEEDSLPRRLSGPSRVASPEGRLIASAGDDHIVRLVDAETQRVRLILRGPAAALRLAFAPDGGHLAVYYNDGSVRVWDVGPRSVETALEGTTR
jgi:WD40 repeat protein